MRVYISGPITGTKDYMERFGWAEDKWLCQGLEVINPAKVNSYLPKSATHAEYMVTSIAMLSICDAIYMLEGWQTSKGAAQELEYAKKNNYTILFQGRCEEFLSLRGGRE